MTMHLLSDQLHAKRAKSWYKGLLTNPRASFNQEDFEERNESNPNSCEYVDAYVWLDYVKVLICLGEIEDAGNAMKKALSLYDRHSLRPIMLFFAGIIMKSLKKFDAASTYFFESCTEGPPKYFTKLEMMVIISRNIEDSLVYQAEKATFVSTDKDDKDDKLDDGKYNLFLLFIPIILILILLLVDDDNDYYYYTIPTYIFSPHSLTRSLARSFYLYLHLNRICLQYGLSAHGPRGLCISRDRLRHLD
jgi:hypothetical protein